MGWYSGQMVPSWEWLSCLSLLLHCAIEAKFLSDSLTFLNSVALCFYNFTLLLHDTSQSWCMTDWGTAGTKHRRGPSLTAFGTEWVILDKSILVFVFLYINHKGGMDSLMPLFGQTNAILHCRDLDQHTQKSSLHNRQADFSVQLFFIKLFIVTWKNLFHILNILEFLFWNYIVTVFFLCLKTIIWLKYTRYAHPYSLRMTKKH